MNIALALLPILVSISTWLTPMPQHTRGWFIAYGSQRLIEANARFHGYDLSPYKDRCGVSAISGADLGKIYWLRRPGGDWYGPCLSVDVASIKDFYTIVYDIGEVAELADPQRLVLGGWKNSAWGEVFIGACAPSGDIGKGDYYLPPLQLAKPGQVEPALYPYPAQEIPQGC